MAPRLRTLSGDEVIRILSQFGFRDVEQRGSHVKLRRVLADGTRQTLTVPRHREIDRGTLLSLFRQAGRFVSDEELRPYFYTS